MMGGMPLETCWAFNKLWNNKFYYKAASCWYFYWVIYDARIHEYQIYSLVFQVLHTCSVFYSSNSTFQHRAVRSKLVCAVFSSYFRAEQNPSWLDNTAVRAAQVSCTSCVQMRMTYTVVTCVQLRVTYTVVTWFWFYSFNSWQIFQTCFL
jgi:hypothetical protein